MTFLTVRADQEMLAWEEAVASVLRSPYPDEAFARVLLESLGRASRLRLVNAVELTAESHPWLIAGSIAGAVGAVGLACYGIVRHRTKGAA